MDGGTALLSNSSSLLFFDGVAVDCGVTALLNNFFTILDPDILAGDGCGTALSGSNIGFGRTAPHNNFSVSLLEGVAVDGGTALAKTLLVSLFDGVAVDDGVEALPQTNK